MSEIVQGMITIAMLWYGLKAYVVLGSVLEDYK